MTRFWITLAQGVDFVLSSFSRMKGGEIFIPKIPSMNIVDLAKAMAPNLNYHVIGIRPGEKLHEVMVTADDSRRTIDDGDRYIICPEFIFDGKESRDLENLVPKDFFYASNTNSQWLDADDLSKLIAEAT